MADLSILIPLYNRAWSIAECLGSIALPGDGSVEVVVVDDGSRDGSAEVARRVIAERGWSDRVTVIEQANAGPGAARNTAAAAATGDWLVLLDSDDMWFPWTVEVLRAELARTPAEVSMVFLGRTHFTDPAELADIARAPLERRVCPSFYAATGSGADIMFGSCNVALRRDRFEAAGGFAREIRQQEDTDLFMRLGGGTMLILSPLLVAIRGLREDSLTGNVAYMGEGIDWLVAQNARGAYTGSPDERARIIAQRLVRRIRAIFAAGHPAHAYRLYLRHLPTLARAGLWPQLWRFPLTPLLHLVRPQNYPFRLRPPR